MSDDVEVVLRHSLCDRACEYAQLVSGLQLAHDSLCDGDAAEGAQVLVSLQECSGRGVWVVCGVNWIGDAGTVGGRG